MEPVLFVFTNDLNDGIQVHLSQFGYTKLGSVVDRSDRCAAFQSYLYRLEKQADRNLINFQIWKYKPLYLRKNNPMHQHTITESPTLDMFKTQLAMVLSNLLWLTCSKQGSWTEQSPEVPSNHSHSDYTIIFMLLDRNCGQEYVVSL